jgi:hypothetical protein
LLADRNIAQRVEELQNRIVDGAVLATTVNRAYVIEKLRLILERCSEQGEDGKMLSPSAACRAAELLGKELGMFVEKRDVNVNFHVDIAERLRRGRLRAAERAREAEASRRVIDVVAEEKSP